MSKLCRLDLLLGIFDGAGHQSVFDGNAFLHAESAHDALDSIRAKYPHQIVFER